MNLSEALCWASNIEQEPPSDICCYITKQPIQYEMKLKCGHSFEYDALVKHFRKTQLSSSKHICPYCRSCFSLSIPYHEEGLDKTINRSLFRHSMFKNNYLNCSYIYTSGKQKGNSCQDCGHYFKKGIYCSKHEKQIMKKEEREKYKKINSKPDTIEPCKQILKNGNPCKCKLFDINAQLCKRHYNLNNKQLNKNT